MKYLLLFISLFIISNNSFAQMSFLHIYDEDIKMSKLKKLAKKNNSDAQCELGVRYYSDKNNHKKALYWWKKAAEQELQNQSADFEYAAAAIRLAEAAAQLRTISELRKNVRR